MFTVDGIEWSTWAEITRISEMTPSEISGMMLDKTYFNDVLGTWLKYDITIVVPYGSEDLYTVLYETLTQPVDGHVFVLPYGQSTVQLQARVASITDIYSKLPSGVVYWRGIKFSVVSNAPTKTMTLSETLTRGRAPFPDLTSVEEGTTYVYTTASGWVPAPTYEDGDVMYF